MIIHPFRALRSRPQSANKVASVPYDIVSTGEAADLAEGNPLSFLHVVRSEIDLPAGTDPYSEAVYQRAAENLQSLRDQEHLIQEENPCLYACRITMGDHVQVGLFACCSVDEYESGLIKKHELTRRDKEDDRTRHIMTSRAQSGPVLLTYRDSVVIADLLDRAVSSEPLLSVKSESDVLHEVFVILDTEPLVEAFANLEFAYVADGHHRTASAARARRLCADANSDHTGNEEYNFFLVAMFPASQMKILAYNRVVADLHGHSTEEVLALASQKFEITEAVSPVPRQARQFCIYLAGEWHELNIKPGLVDESDPVKSLDSSLLQAHFIESILGIKDIRTDKRIRFIGGSRGIEALEHLVDNGEAAVAFSMYPTSIEQLMSIADAGQIMPPKSTWFEPKLRSGLVVHLI